jgi:translation initiation factor IF-1
MSADEVQSPFVPQPTGLVRGRVVEPLPDGLFRVELENGDKVLAHVADRLGTHFVHLRAGDRVRVELAETDRSRGRIKEILR